MAYDRFDRDERSRWSDDRSDGEARGARARWSDDRSERAWRGDDRGSGGRDERGFWERASDEVASWFGDDDADRRKRQDRPHDNRSERGSSSHERDYDRGYGRDFERDDNRSGQNRSERESNYDRGVFNRGGSSERDYNPRWRRELSGGERGSGHERDRHRERESGSGYRPMAGDYGRGDHESEQFFAASGYGRGEPRRSQRQEGRDERTSFAGSPEGARGSGRDFDPHYHSWRDRHMSDLDRDYDDYRREHQSKFESDFGSWREKRQQKRGLLGQIREHMDVVGNDDKHVGTVDKVAGDRIILTKSDPESGGAHHSLSCSEIDRVEDDKVILDCSADEAKNRWRDESRSRALFERDDQGEMGPRNLNRSFEGTYR